jgi:glutamate formiminotransferase
VVDAIASAIRGVSGVTLLDYSSDASHHRSVFTMVGTSRPLEQAVTALFLRAAEDLDLRTHRGVHPRVGAVDVVPFIPLLGCTIAECVDLARQAGRAIADRFQVPVYLYGEAASQPARRELADIRRGQFEGLAAKMASADWAPDFGPHRPHPTLGASVVGVRRLLVAYNVNLRSGRLDVATAIASAVRQSSGGLPGVQAMGVLLVERGIVQVSTNLTDHSKTKLIDVFNAVKLEAARYGIGVLESEIVGLTPAAALERTSAAELQLTGFSPQKVLENRLASLDPGSADQTSAQRASDDPAEAD